MSQTLTTMIDPFDKSHHACTLSQMLKRSLELGPKYYCWDLPRYFVERGDSDFPSWILEYSSTRVRKHAGESIMSLSFRPACPRACGCLALPAFD